MARRKPVPAAPLRDAAAYLRVSDPKQVDQGMSLPAQRSMAEHWAREHGLRVVKWYEDKGITASKTGRVRFTADKISIAVSRPGWGSLLADMMAGAGPRVLVVQDLDRAQRNEADLYLLKGLVAAGIELHVVRDRKVVTRDNLDAETLVLGVMGAVASHEGRKKAQRVRDVASWKRSQGLHSGKAPLGYRWKYAGDRRNERGALVVDGKVAFKLRKLFAAAATGMLGLSDLFRLAVELGLWGPRSSPTRIRLVLSHPIYIGGFRRQGPRSTCIDTTEGNNPTIIERRIWDRVQEIYFRSDAKRMRGPRATTNGKAPTHVLAGVFHKGGIPLTRKADRSCYRWRDDAQEWHMVKDEVLLAALADHVIGPLEVDAEGLDEFRRLLHQQVEDATPSREDLERELGLRRKEAEKTLRLLTDPTLDLTDAEEDKLRRQRGAAAARAVEIERALADARTMMPTEADIDTLIRYVEGLGRGWLTEPPEVQRRVLLQILDFSGDRPPVGVNEDGEIVEIAFAPGWEEVSRIVLEAGKRVATRDARKWREDLQEQMARDAVLEAVAAHERRVQPKLRVITTGSARGSGSRGPSSGG